MTSPLNREELRKKCDEILWDIALSGEESEKSIDRLTDFIDQYAQQVAIEARIDEQDQLSWHLYDELGAPLYPEIARYHRERKTELEQKLEKERKQSRT